MLLRGESTLPGSGRCGLLGMGLLLGERRSLVRRRRAEIAVCVDCVVAVKVKARRGRGWRRAGLRHGRRVKGCLRLTKAGTPLWCLRARGGQGRMTRRAGLRRGLHAKGCLRFT